MKYEITLKVLPLESLIHAPYNPREGIVAGTEDYEHLKKSLLDHGQTEPLVVNLHTMHVVGGNQRMTVMQNLGWKEALCVVFTQEDILQEKKIAVALNKISGRWDTDKLGDILRDDDVLAYETGFDRDEVMEYRHLEQLGSEEPDYEAEDYEEDFDQEDEDDSGIDNDDDEEEPVPESKINSVLVQVNHLKFKVEASLYNRLLEGIRDRGIFDEKSTAEEMKRRMLNG